MSAEEIQKQLQIVLQVGELMKILRLRHKFLQEFSYSDEFQQVDKEYKQISETYIQEVEKFNKMMEKWANEDVLNEDIFKFFD